MYLSTKYLKNKAPFAIIVGITFSLMLQGCDDGNNIAPHPGLTFKRLNYSKVGKYLYNFADNPTLTFKRVKNKIPIDTITLVQTLALFDTMIFPSEPFEGTYSRKDIHIEREKYRYVDASSNEFLNVEIWANDSTGLFDASIFLQVSNVYFNNHIGSSQFGIGDQSDPENPQNIEISKTMYKDVWSNFTGYRTFTIFDGSSRYGGEILGVKAHYNYDYGPLKFELQNSIVWERI